MVEEAGQGCSCRRGRRWWKGLATGEGGPTRRGWVWRAMHSRVSGAGPDYFRPYDEASTASGVVRKNRPAGLKLGKLGPGPPRNLPEEPNTTRDRAASGNRAVDLSDFPRSTRREVMPVVRDGSRFDEYSPLYGQPGPVTGWGVDPRLIPVGILANARACVKTRPRRGHGRFILLAKQLRTPRCCSWQKLTGYMVGKGGQRGRPG